MKDRVSDLPVPVLPRTTSLLAAAAVVLTDAIAAVARTLMRSVFDHSPAGIQDGYSCEEIGRQTTGQ